VTTDGFDPAALVAEISTATQQVLANAERLTPEQLAGPSLLPGWTRGHVLTHLARNADGLTNLATWARTGVVTLMYGPGNPRDADIEAGAGRPLHVQLADLSAASARLEHELRTLPPAAWGTKIRLRPERPEIPALQLPRLRLRELYVHHVDLDAGWTPAHWPADYVARELNEAAAGFRGHPGLPPLLLVDEDGRRTLAIGPEGLPPAATVTGRAQTLLAWIVGRTRGDGLTVDPAGPLPALPPWPS
jgi:maleylpyruvate isomerase